MSGWTSARSLETNLGGEGTDSNALGPPEPSFSKFIDFPSASPTVVSVRRSRATFSTSNFYRTSALDIF